MIKTLALRGLFMILGYALAVLVATTTVCVVMGIASALPDEGAMGSFYRYLRDLPAMFAVGSMMTAIYALPGWLITVTLAEWRNERRRLLFGLAGFLTSVLALFISNGGQMFSGQTLLTYAVFIGGFAGGLAYWAVAGKSSGNWKQTRPVAP